MSEIADEKVDQVDDYVSATRREWAEKCGGEERLRDLVAWFQPRADVFADAVAFLAELGDYDFKRGGSDCYWYGFWDAVCALQFIEMRGIVRSLLCDMKNHGKVSEETMNRAYELRIWGDRELCERCHGNNAPKGMRREPVPVTCPRKGES